LSQRDVYEILKELGGKASTGEISKRAKEKYPTRSLHQYVSDRLNKLAKKDVVKRMEGEGAYWKIIDDDYLDKNY